jgi:signal transduction histidine kinase
MAPIQATPDVILIVDDSPENLEALRLMLSKQGYHPITAPDGETALALAESRSPDLVLLDIGLPGMSGYDVCRCLKSNTGTRRIPIVFLSAHNEADDKVRAFTIGGVDYITKPFFVEEVLARIETHLNLRRYERHLEAMVAERTRDLANAKDAAEAANDAKSRLLMNMSHELRTPLTGILTAADIALEAGDETRNEMLSIIKASGRQLNDTLTTLIDFAAYESGDTKLIPTPFRLETLLQALPTRFVHKGIERELDLTLRQDGELPDRLVGDRTRLAFVLRALLDNAAKFSTDAPQATLSVRCEPTQDDAVRLHFSVRDNGIGIHPDHHDAIFDPFFQVDTSIVRQYDGVGIGLALCRRYVRLMGSDIVVDSRSGRGSTFTFEAVFSRA